MRFVPLSQDKKQKAKKDKKKKDKKKKDKKEKADVDEPLDMDRWDHILAGAPPDPTEKNDPFTSSDEEV